MKWKKPEFFLWKISLALFVLASLALGILIWHSGAGETKDAFESGRRLIIKLDGGEIQGKLITLDAPKPPPVPIPVPAPPPHTPEATPAADPAATAPAETAPVEPAPAPEAAVPAPESTGPGEIATAPPMASIPAPAVLPTAMTGVNPALVEKGENGDLPIIGADGTKPWRYYSKPFERKNSAPMVAIIVTGLGQNKAASDNALKLPEQITVGFSPYVRDPESWIAAVRATGHEMLIEAPMEAADYPASDPGPQGLLISKGLAENHRRLEWQMTRFPSSIGFLTPQSEVVTADAESLKMILQGLANRGLLLAVGREPHRKDIREAIESSNTANVIADFLIDEDLSVTAIQTRLTALEQKAKKDGFAVGVAGAYPVTIEQLHLWAATLQEKGIVLVPVSAIAKLRFS